MKLTTKQINELKKTYPHLLRGTIKSMTTEYKTERGLTNALTRKNAEAEKAHAAPAPEIIIVSMRWLQSTYGYCPRASMRYRDTQGWHNVDNAAYAGGWGYDKTSTILADVLNQFRGLRWSLRRKNYNNKPYGVYKSEYNDGMYFDGGIGVSAYYRVCDWAGYKLKHMVESKNFDVFTITRKGIRQ